MTDNEFVRVRYKFKNDRNFIAITVTEQQYANLLEIPMIEKCEMLHNSNLHLIRTVEKAHTFWSSLSNFMRYEFGHWVNLQSAVKKENNN